MPTTRTGVILSNRTDNLDTELKPESWHKMSLTQLWEQHAVLNSRLTIAQQLQKEHLIRGMSMGIGVLDELIRVRATEHDEINLM